MRACIHCGNKATKEVAMMAEGSFGKGGVSLCDRCVEEFVKHYPPDCIEVRELNIRRASA